MPICRNCGVEVEDHQSKCPLCGSPVGNDEVRETPVPEKKQILNPDTAVDRKRQEKVRILFHEIIDFIALAGAVVVWAVDYAYGMAITWSRFPLISIGFVWLLFSLPFWLKRRVYLMVCAEALNMALFLYCMDRFTAGDPWFHSLALPLILGFGAAVLLSLGSIRLLKLSALGGISVSLIAAGLWLLWLEIIVNRFIGEGPGVSWSLIAAASVVPIIAFLFSFDARLKRQGSDFRKHFHV